MELIFTKTEEGYVAEFEVASDFNLHLERVKNGLIQVFQRGCPEGKYEMVYTAGGSYANEVYDRDFGALVYPKWIKVVSSNEVGKGVVTEAK